VFGREFERVCRQLLRAAYLGTLLAAIALDRSPVVLTLVGGGVFGNPRELIWESIMWAFERVEVPAARLLEVIVNARKLGDGGLIETVLSDVRHRGGAVLEFDSDGLTRIER
jgi:predicted Rdx family selenoprotein